MGKNKLSIGNPIKSGNPIYKKAGGGAFFKAKNKIKPVKLNLKKVQVVSKVANKKQEKKNDSLKVIDKVAKASSLTEQCKMPLSEKVDVEMKEENIEAAENTEKLESV